MYGIDRDAVSIYLGKTTSAWTLTTGKQIYGQHSHAKMCDFADEKLRDVKVDNDWPMYR